jgi:hypothetical protein
MGKKARLKKSKKPRKTNGLEKPHRMLDPCAHGTGYSSVIWVFTAKHNKAARVLADSTYETFKT